MKPLFVCAAVGLAGLGGLATLASRSGSQNTQPGWLSFGDSSGTYNAPTNAFGCSVAHPDYPQRAEETQWAFNDAEATLRFCLNKPQPRYTLAATSAATTGGDRLTVGVSLRGAEVFAFPADEQTVFDIIGHRLYYTEPGATVVSVDLTTGTELWRTKLKGAGDGAAARLNLKADEDGVTALGREPAGKYVEVLAADTGETAGHKVVE